MTDALRNVFLSYRHDDHTAIEVNCAELCDCNENCVDRALKCEAFDDAILENAFGRRGNCIPPEAAAKHALSCAR